MVSIITTALVAFVIATFGSTIIMHPAAGMSVTVMKVKQGCRCGGTGRLLGR